MLVCPTCQGSFAEGTLVCPVDGARLHAAPGDAADPLLGRMLDSRLRVLRRIGEGGMGAVYAAEHVGLGKEVAVKVLGEKHVGHSDVAARLRAEARLASAIRDEHIVEVFDVGETEDGRAFIVMELLEGESLGQRLGRQGALGEQAMLGIARQVAQALHAAHQQGIVHRDVKPENVFLCPRPEGKFVKVLDFGISKALRGTESFAPRLTHTGMIMGTPLYMSPEQARGEEQLDHRIDIYAFGVLLYECLTGQVPFSANNYLGVVSKIIAGGPMPPRQRRPDLPISSACEQLVLRALANDREERYPSMAAVIGDLDRIAAGATDLAPNQEPAPGGRSGLGMLIAGVGILVALVVLVTLWGERRGPAAPPKHAASAPPGPAPAASPPPAAVLPSAPSPAASPPRTETVPPPRTETAPPRREIRSRPRQRPSDEAPLPDVLHEEQAPNPFRPARPR